MLEQAGTRGTQARRAALVLCGAALLPIWPRGSLAQTETSGPEDYFVVGLSLTSHQWKDKVLNPAKHAGWFPTLEIQYDRPREDSASRVHLQLVFSPIASRYDPGKDSFASGIQLSYRRVRRTAFPRAGLNLWIGAEAKASSDFAYFSNWDDSHFYWLTAYALGFAGSLEHVMSPSRTVSLEWSVPVLAVVSRPRSPILYKVVNSDFGAVVARLHKNARLTSLHEHRAVDLALRYARPHATWGHSFFWHLEYADTDLPYSEPAQILRHSFGFTVAW